MTRGNLRIRAAVCAAAVAVALASAATAGAEESCQPRDGLSTCVASDNLWPHVGGGRWFSLPPTHTAAAGSASFGLVPSYYRRPIGLVVASPDPEGTTIYAVDNALAAAFLLGFAVTDRLQLQLAAPAVLYQNGAGKADVVGSDDSLSRSAVGDLRFGTTVALVPRTDLEEGFGWAARFETAAPTGQSDAYAGHGTATFAPGTTIDYRTGGVTLGFDAGARIRDYSQLAGVAVGSQLSASLGVGYDVLANGWLSANLEAHALFTLLQQKEWITEPGEFEAQEQPSGKPHIPAEWMLSVRSAGLLDGRLRGSLGGGSFIPTGEDTAVTTPAFRAAFAIHYVLDGKATDDAP